MSIATIDDTFIKIKAGNKREEDKFILREYAKCDKALEGIIRSEDDRHDIITNAIIHFLQRYVHDDTPLVLNGNPSGCIYTIARNLHRDTLRKAQRRRINEQEYKEYAVVHSRSDLTTEVIQNEQIIEAREKSVQVAIHKMGKRCREIILDFYKNNLKLKDIQEKFKFPSYDAAKTAKYNCLQKLRRLSFSVFCQAIKKINITND